MGDQFAFLPGRVSPRVVTQGESELLDRRVVQAATAEAENVVEQSWAQAIMTAIKDSLAAEIAAMNEGEEE